MSIDEMVDDLGRQVHPYVKDPVLALVTECILQVLLHIRHDHMSPAKVHRVPLAVSLPFWLPLLTRGSVCKQVIDKLNRKHLDLGELLKLRHIDVLPFGNIEKHSIDEE